MSKGDADPKPLTDQEINEMRNMKKKVDYLKDQLDLDPKAKGTGQYDSGSQTDSDHDDEDSDEEERQKVVKAKAQKKGQRAGVSAEVYGGWNKKGDFTPKVVAKTADMKERLGKRLLQAFMFNALDTKEFEIVVDSIEEVKCQPGTAIIKEGEKGDCMYVVEQGTFACTKVFKGQTAPTFLKEYHPGDGFGELALLYNAPRAATITAQTEGIVWRLDRDTFNHIVKDAAAKKREKYETFLESVKILKTMDPYERSQVADALQAETHTKDSFIIKEGDIGDKFYMIIEGEAVALKNIDGVQTKVYAYKGGDYFGERALLTNDARAASIVVSSETAKTISLDRETFKRLLGPLEDILSRNMDVYNEYGGAKKLHPHHQSNPGEQSHH